VQPVALASLASVSSTPPADRPPVPLPGVPILDTGATHTILRESDEHLLADRSPDTGFVVSLPNGAQLSSVSSGNFVLSSATRSPITAHVFPDAVLDRSLISVADLCNQGYTATFTATDATISDGDRIVLRSTKHPAARLWPVLTPSGHHVLSTAADQPTPSLHAAVHHQFDADFVHWVHRSLGCPPVSTLLKALRAGYLRTFPRITAHMVAANPPISAATARGHLDQNRQGQRPTSQQPSPPSSPHVRVEELEDDVLSADPADDEPIIFSVDLSPQAQTIHTDLTGRFPVTSRSGNNYLLVSVYKGYIYAVPMPDRNAAAYIAGYRATLAHFRSLGLWRLWRSHEG
jgi:hypothetical protein